jgi:hypothetical protein
MSGAPHTHKASYRALLLSIFNTQMKKEKEKEKKREKKKKEKSNQLEEVG